MGSGPREVFYDEPQAEPGRRGLLSALRTVAGGDLRWRQGATIDPDTCQAADPQAVVCDASLDKPTIAPETPIDFDPIYVFGVDVCSAMLRGRDREGRARRNLLATKSHQIETMVSDGAGTTNPYFTDGVTATTPAGSSALPAMSALALVEEFAGKCLHGQRALIHAPLSVASLWDAGGGLRIVGDLMLTALDSIVVAGSGYSGFSPAGVADAAVRWVYATGPMTLREDAIYDPAADYPQSRIDRATNDETWRLEQTVLVTYNTCCVIGVPVAVPLT